MDTESVPLRGTQLLNGRDGLKSAQFEWEFDSPVRKTVGAAGPLGRVKTGPRTLGFLAELFSISKLTHS